MSVSLSIEARHGEQLIGQYAFTSGDHRLVKIGSVATANVPLQDPEVNRLHAAIELSDDEAVLKDLGTNSGTFLNGERITRRRIQDGDVIKIGQTTLLVRIRIADAVAATGPSPTLVNELAGMDKSQIRRVRAFVSSLRPGGGSPRPVEVERRPVEASRRQKPPSRFNTRVLLAALRRDRSRSRAAVLGVGLLCVSAVVAMIVTTNRAAHRRHAHLEALGNAPRAPEQPTPAVLPFTPAAAPATPEPVRAAPEPVRPAPEPVRPAIAPVQHYTVRRGDSLGRIAKKLFGDEKYAQELFAANRDKLRDPSKIDVGMVLSVPAIEHEPPGHPTRGR